jgi:hypothetical protein
MSKLKKKAKEEQLKQFEESKKIVLELDTSLPEAKYNTMVKELSFKVGFTVYLFKVKI